MWSNRLLSGVLFAGLIAGGSVFGADSTNLMLDEIVVKGQKESPREESLTIREVRESPARDMGEALKAVEGVTCVHKGAIANDVVLRGFQKDNINVFLDGVRLHGACPNRMDSPAFHFDFAEVEQVKVTKGPYDIANPGGLGGVVEAQSKKPKKGLGADLSLTTGSYYTVNTSAVGSYGGEKFDGLLGYAFKYSDVPKSGNGAYITQIYDPSYYPGLTQTQLRSAYRPENISTKAYSMNTAWTKLGYAVTDKSRMELGYSFQDAEHVLYPYLKMDARYDRTNRFNWTYKAESLTPAVKGLELQAYWDTVRHLMDDSFRVSSDPATTLGYPAMRQNALRNSGRTYSMATDASTEVAGAKVKTVFAIGPGKLTTGIDYYNRNWDARNTMLMLSNGMWMYMDTNMIPDVNIDNLGLFTEYGLPLGEKLSLKAGVRGDLTWARADKTNYLTDTLYGKNSASFGEASANVQLTYLPVAGVEAFVGLARGSRTPDPQELFMYLGNGREGNPNLKPTNNYQTDLGIKYATDRFYVNASAFYSYLVDYINTYGFQRNGVNITGYQNVNATMWGYELGTQYSLPMDLFLKGSLSSTWGGNNDTHTPLSEIPPLRGSVGIRYDNNVFFFDVTENLSSRQNRTDSSLSELQTAGYVTTDLKTGFKYETLSVVAGINNLFDIQYYNYLSYQRDPFASGVKVPENGLNFYLTAQYTF